MCLAARGVNELAIFVLEVCIKKLFGNGKKGDAEYQKRYEKFLGDDGRAYLRRRD